MLIKLRPKSEFSRNVLTLMTGTTIAQAIPIAISPILTRIYTPEDFGTFTLFITIVGLLSVISSLTYEQTIMLPKYNKYVINIFILSLGLIFLTSFFSFLIIVMFKNEILKLLNNNTLGNWIYFVPMTVFFVALFNLLTNYNNRIKEYKDIAKATVIKSFVLSIAQVVIGILKNGFAGLIVGQLLAQIFANLKLAKNILKNEILLKKISLKRIFVLSKKYINFPKYYMPHALLNTISASLPIYMFSTFFGTTIVGYYSLALMIVLSPMMIISGSIAKVYNQKIVEIYNAGEDTYIFTISMIKSLGIKIFFPFIFFVIISPQIFIFIFGNKWEESSIYLQLLSPYILMIFLVSIIAYIPSLYKKQLQALLIEIVYFIVKLISLYIGCVVYKDIYVALGLFSLSSIIILGFNLRWFLYLTKKGY
jgi:O-antigen/teichoic acid export membrane protein